MKRPSQRIDELITDRALEWAIRHPQGALKDSEKLAIKVDALIAYLDEEDEGTLA